MHFCGKYELVTILVTWTVSSVRKQQAVMEKEGTFEAPRNVRRAAAGQRRANQEELTLEFSVPKYEGADILL